MSGESSPTALNNGGESSSSCGADWAPCREGRFFFVMFMCINGWQTWCDRDVHTSKFSIYTAIHIHRYINMNELVCALMTESMYSGPIERNKNDGQQAVVWLVVESWLNNLIISFVGPVSSATKEWKHISNHQSLDDTSGDIEQETKLFFSLTVVSASCGVFPYFIIFPYCFPLPLRMVAKSRTTKKRVETC